jgi:transcriptional regulator with XRE-family HTH domain
MKQNSQTYRSQTCRSAAKPSCDRLIVAMTVRMARAALGWSQSELGHHLGMSQRGIHRVEQGHSTPRRATLLALEAVFTKAGLKIEERTDGGFCVHVSALAIAEIGMATNVVAPSLSGPGSDESEMTAPAPAELLVM